MDEGNKCVRQKNPRENASILSIITFFYTLPLFKKGCEKKLDDEDVYNTVPKYLSERLGNKLEAYWHLERKTKENPSVIRVLISCYGRKYLIIGLVEFFAKTAFILQPLILERLLRYFRINETEMYKDDAYMYATLFIGVNLLYTIYSHNYQQYVIEYGIEVRTAFAALMYKKILKLHPSTFSSITMGNIVTLITKDVAAFENAIKCLNDLWVGFLQIVIIAYIISTRMGLSVLSAVGFFVVIIPLEVFLGQKISCMRLISSRRTDERLQATKETLSAIKVIKMYTWERFFEKNINNYRKKEMRTLAFIYYLKSFLLIVGALVSKLSFYLLLMTFIWTGHYLQPEVAYFVQACYTTLIAYITGSIPYGINQTAELFASARRIQNFLNGKELESEPIKHIAHPKVYLRNVAAEVNGVEVLKDVSLFANKGLLIVTGNVGSGKTVLLKTIMKDYTVSRGQILTEGTISYVSQEPWLFPSALKQNILFGQAYNEKRYQQVLDACALTDDLKQFKYGDRTIVGDRGVNLSKGQQSRINLARAVYRDSDIYLLDDCLSALDTHISQHVFDKCIKGFLRNKIVILVTHNINHIKDNGHNVLFVDNGTTLTIEQQKKTLDRRITYYIDDVDLDYLDGQMKKKEKIDKIEDEQERVHYIGCDDEPLLKEKHVEESEENLYLEKKKSGKVSFSVYLQYYRFAGGICALLLVIVVSIISQVALLATDKLLNKWVNIEEEVTYYVESNTTNTSNYTKTLQTRNLMINMYSIATVGAVILTLFKAYVSFYFCVKGSRNLHKAMISTVTNAYMYFFDSHFIGNIINRFSKDLAVVDDYIPLLIYDNIRGILLCIAVIGLIASVNLTLIIPAVVLLITLYLIRRYYLPTGRAIKRLESATRSPVIGYLNATLEGLTTVRAYEKQALLVSQFDKHLDLYTSSYYMMQCTLTAFGFLLDIICNIFTAAVVLWFTTFKSGVKVGDAGLAITQAIKLISFLPRTIKQLSELENNMTSVERALEYTDVDTEDKESGDHKENWPSQGKIEYKEVTLSYRTTEEQVLKKISFVLEPGKKIGIVGRTGAGKSSIISALFRLYNFEGKIFIDDVDTKTVSLYCLRSNISIIPQDPILFTGTIKSNIDPADRYSDFQIWEAIEKVNLKQVITSLQEGIVDGGSNYSTGQRQLICLARALVSKCRIIVLDEATASMDSEMCDFIQNTKREIFADCTVITIAHRLSTVADSDKVMVIDAGRIVEYDSPTTLMKNKGGFFYSLINQDGLIET